MGVGTVLWKHVFWLWVARGYKHVYMHYFQTYSLKRLDQSKPTLRGASLEERTHVYKNCLGHMAKMAAIPIYEKEPLKRYFS